MQVLVNARHEPLPTAFVELMEKRVSDELESFSGRLTRVEIHLQDLNAQKGGVDKRCLIEARPKGLAPMAAHHESTTVQDAFRGALEKLQRVLAHRFGRLDSKGRETG